MTRPHRTKPRTAAELGLNGDTSPIARPDAPRGPRVIVNNRALLLRVPQERHAEVRDAFIEALDATQTRECATDALRELHARAIGPAWLRELCKAQPTEALLLMSRTVRWSLGRRAGKP